MTDSGLMSTWMGSVGASTADLIFLGDKDLVLLYLGAFPTNWLVLMWVAFKFLK
jgi:hypothetical protein